MKELEYPRKVEDPGEVLNQDLLDMTTAHMLSWHQGVGNYGQLQMHACWGNRSSLDRRYQGQTISRSYFRLEGFSHLYNKTGDKRWKWMVNDIVANVLNLQAEDGGFFHAGDAQEPTYLSSQTCPIHQNLGALTLLNYLSWEHASPELSERVEEAVKKQVAWFLKGWWKNGNQWKSPLEDAGFCGVTNQDLVVVMALAKYAKVFGDDEYYVKYGKPTLDVFLTPKFYHEKIGLFERCDKPNFVERTGYNFLIIGMLQGIYEMTGDERLPAIYDNVCDHLFDAVYEEEDGQLYLAWGAQTDPVDKSKVVGWDRYPNVMTDMSPLLTNMKGFLERHPDSEKQAIVHRLEQTMASYVYSDGTQPLNLRAGDPFFQIACTFPNPLWYYVMHRLGDAIKSPKQITLPTVHRKCSNVLWKSGQRLWSIEVDGVRRYAGLKMNPSGMALGPDETVHNADFSLLDEPDVVEVVPLLREPAMA